MMKQFYLLLFLLFASMYSNAEKIKIGNLYYYLNSDDKTAELTNDIVVESGDYEQNYHWDENYDPLPVDLVIPPIVDYNGEQYEVTSIGENALMCTNFESVIIPNTVHTIGSSAFWTNFSLTEVFIPNSVKKIENGAFSNCYGLNSIVIPSSVEYIGWSNFTETDYIYCQSEVPPTYDDSDPWWNVRCLKVPKGCVEQYKNAKGWNSIPRIEEDRSNDKVKIGDLYYILNSDDNTAEVTFLSVYRTQNGNYVSGNVIIPESVDFEDKQYEVTAIGCRAFYGCAGLTSVSFPKTLKLIDSDAFHGCNISQIKITDLAAWCNLQSYSEITTSHSLVVNDQEIFDLVIPEGVTEIAYGAFSNCVMLESVTIPASVKRILNLAFENCRRIRRVLIEDLKAWCDIEFTSFASNPFCVNQSRGSCQLLLNGESVEEVVFPEGTESIKKYAFAFQTDLKSVTIPNTVTYIGDYAFYGCELQNIYCNMDEPTHSYMYETLFSQYAFENAQLFVPARSIDEYLSDEHWNQFSNIYIVGPEEAKVRVDNIYYYINSETMTAEVTRLPTGWWIDNVSGELIIPSTIESDGCEYTVTKVGAVAFFRKCSEMTSVVLPASVEQIGGGAFRNCGSLESVYCMSATPPTTPEQVKVFEETILENTPLYVPEGSLSLYQNAPMWKNFKTIEAIPMGAIGSIEASVDADVIGYYNIQGIYSSKPWPGINVVVYSDGSNNKLINQE